MSEVDEILMVADPPNFPPTCSFGKITPEHPNSINITIKDTGEGLSELKVHMLSLENAKIIVPPLRINEKNDPFIITAIKLNQSKESRVLIEPSDFGGKSSLCDSGKF